MRLSLTGSRLLDPARASTRLLYGAVLASLLFVGAAMRVVDITYDRFDYDEYHLRIGVEQPFADYARDLQGTDAIQFVVHYWLTYRLLDGSLLAFRSLSLAASLAVLCVTAWGLHRLWPGQPALSLIVLLILAPNAHALFLNRYLFPYGNTFLIAVALFFLFARLAEGPLDRRRWLWISAILPMAVFFSNEFLIIPLVVGVFAVLLFRWARADGRRRLARLGAWAWELKPLAIFPLIYALKQIVFPYTLWGAEQRVDQLDLYFGTSGYPSTAAGVAGFLRHQTAALWWSLLGPSGIRDDSMLVPVCVAGCGLLMILALLHLARGVARRQGDLRSGFTAVYLLATLALLAAAGVLGLYPYGLARYTPFLFMPAAILVGQGGALLIGWIGRRLRLAGTPPLLLAGTAAVLLIAGTYFCATRYTHVAATQAEDQQALAWLESSPADLVLSDHYMAMALRTRVPSVYARLHDMGPGTYFGWGQDAVPTDLAETIAGSGQSPPVDSILVVFFPSEVGRTDHYTGFAGRHPAWSSLINSHFALESSVESLHVAGRLYRRKPADPGE